MKIPLYILGILKRQGAQHGYQIKKNISEQISDFTQIKLPVIYYHLEKMKDKGLLSSKTEKDSNKVEKTIYSITTKGKNEFKTYLKSVCDFNYKPEFLNDALFFFSDSLDQNQICTVLEQYIGKIKKDIKSLQEHRNFAEKYLSNDELIMSSHIFNHHDVHFKAELKWAKDVLTQFETDKTQL